MRGHLIRAAVRFANYKHRRPKDAGQKPNYTAVNKDAVQAALKAFAASETGRKYISTTAIWRAPGTG